MAGGRRAFRLGSLDGGGQGRRTTAKRSTCVAPSLERAVEIVGADDANSRAGHRRATLHAGAPHGPGQQCNRQQGHTTEPHGSHLGVYFLTASFFALGNLLVS